ncbi:MAG: hypothetical protein AB7H80_10360 [Candidatus Kapaibacterium sp.]
MRAHLLFVPLFCAITILSNIANLQSQTDEEQTVPLFPPVDGILSPTSQHIPPVPFENFSNSKSGVELFVSNYGTIGLNGESGTAGGIWPRGSGMSYLYGGGFWFGAEKLWRRDTTNPSSPRELQKKTVVSFNPNSGKSWFVPGVITSPLSESKLELTPEAINNYRLYSSLDYDPQTGEQLDPNDKLEGRANWPVWDIDPNRVPGKHHYFGDYLQNPAERTIEFNPEGPSIISDQDMVAVFKDTDLSFYEIEENKARSQGYPLGIQVEQQVFNWETGRLKDVVVIRYRFINKSPDTLYNCYMAPVYDIDIGSAWNDRMRVLIPSQHQDSLNMGVMWSEASGGDSAYGNVGVDILESPAVYPVGNEEEGFIRRDKAYYENSEQLGLHALRNWVIDVDPQTPEERYRFMAVQTRDGDNGGGDKRLCISTGPFNMYPGDTAVVAVGLIFAYGLVPEQKGTWEDLKDLIDLDMYTQQMYDRVLRTSSVEGDRAWRMFRELDLQ